MNNNWKQFVQTQITPQAKTDAEADNKVANSRIADSRNIICDLSQFNTLVIAGEDAAGFMQGQFTNDVELVDDNHAQLSAFCNKKGRMLANFRLFEHKNNYFLSLKSDLTELSIQHLQNYILRAHVAIQDVSEQLIHIGLSGSNTSELLSPFIDNIDHQVDSISHNDDYIAICIASGDANNVDSDNSQRYEIFCGFEQAKKLWQKLAEQAEAVPSSTWDYLNIKDGIPFIDASTSGQFVPQMANMELINGVSFSKGCFTGQEIVARTHYLGKQKRRTYRIKITTDDKPAAGDQVATPTSSENQYVGTLITVCKTASNEYQALAVIQIKAAEDGALKLKDADSKIDLLTLPYALVAEES